MLNNIVIHPTIALFTLTTAFGVMVHDMQLDRATSVALALPATVLVAYAVIDSGLKGSDSHVHVERATAPNHINSVRAMIPRIQPRDDQDRQSFSGKRAVYYSSGGDSTLWPSV